MAATATATGPTSVRKMSFHRHTCKGTRANGMIMETYFCHTIDGKGLVQKVREVNDPDERRKTCKGFPPGGRKCEIGIGSKNKIDPNLVLDEIPLDGRMGGEKVEESII